MSDNEDADKNQKPAPGPGVTAWLSETVGAPRASKASAKPILPNAFMNLGEGVRRLAFTPPEDVRRAEGATLQQIEMRGLPKSVTLSHGEFTNQGFWLIPPDQLDGIYAIVPQDVALPFSVMLKGVFKNDADDEIWSELTGYEFVDAEAASGQAQEIIPAGDHISSENTNDDLAPDSMAVIDLDVSVGTDDESVLRHITVKFSGLPEGARLSAGVADNGVWQVPATELAELSIIIPEHIRDFDLDVVMEVDGEAPQTASIHVENTPEIVDPDAAFTVRLAPMSDGHKDDDAKTRVSIYTDGSVIYDRIINWTAISAPHLDLLIPYTDNALPFEIVMRYDAFGNMDNAPKLMGLRIDETEIPPNSPAISAHGQMLGDGQAWSGDLVVDVRHALKSLETRFSESAPLHETAHQPSEPAERHGDAIFDNTLDETESDTPPTAKQEHPPAEKDTDGNVLVVDASYSDLIRPAFLNELRSLRDFIRTRPDDASGEIYDRLGIDVTKWHDMSVRGPTGAEVELDPRFPALAPSGGIDNTRAVLPLALSEVPPRAGIIVRVNGMAPGALLSRGQNLGGGIWQLDMDELENVSVLPPIADRKSMALQLAWNDDAEGNDPDIVVPRKTLIVGQRHKPPKSRGTEMCEISLRLDPEIFDKDGHGSLSLTIGELPPGVILSNGRNHGGGVWTVELKSGQDITINAAAATQPFSLTLTCVALNPQTGNSTVVSRIFDVTPSTSKIRMHTDLAA